MADPKKIEDLNRIAKRLRRRVVELVGVGRAGHLGGSCSLADITTALYFDVMRYDPKNPRWGGRDYFLLSKGHAALVQYAALIEMGVIPEEETAKIKSLGAMLQGHPDMTKAPGIEANTGSLGQGLSVAVGLALSARLDDSGARVYCCMGDGEQAEGQIWEAANTASFYKLDNLCGIVDRNRLQASDTVEKIMGGGDLLKKWEAFGWKVLETDGHDMAALLDTFEKARQVKGQPVVVVANTVKGKGVPFAENVVGFHNGTLTQEQYDQALAGLAE